MTKNISREHIKKNGRRSVVPAALKPFRLRRKSRPQETKIYNDHLTVETLSEDKSFTDADGVMREYSYHVLRLLSDAADAKTINREIADCFGFFFEETRSSMKNAPPRGIHAYRSAHETVL